MLSFRVWHVYYSIIYARYLSRLVPVVWIILVTIFGLACSHPDSVLFYTVSARHHKSYCGLSSNPPLPSAFMHNSTALNVLGSIDDCHHRDICYSSKPRFPQVPPFKKILII